MSGVTIPRRSVPRRSILAGLAVGLAMPGVAARPRDIRLIAGTYANEGGAGLYPVDWRPADDQATVGPANRLIRNASFGVRSSAGRWYCVDEAREGRIGVYGPGWSRLAIAGTGGADPCHAALDPGERRLAVANYSSGTVALYRLDRRGRPDAPQMLVHHGRGPDTARQAEPHAHWVGFSRDGRWLHAVDLGADAIFATPIDPVTGRAGTTAVAWQAPPGTGPRHMVRHPRLPRAYVVSELSNRLFTLSEEPEGRYATLEAQPVRATEATGPAFAAHIAIDSAGRRLYVSIRGDDSLAVFALDDHGIPSLLQHIGSGGIWPRQFLMLEPERRLLVANERSGSIAAFDLASDGRLRATGVSVAVPGVVFLGHG